MMNDYLRECRNCGKEYNDRDPSGMCSGCRQEHNDWGIENREEQKIIVRTSDNVISQILDGKRTRICVQSHNTPVYDQHGVMPHIVFADGGVYQTIKTGTQMRFTDWHTHVDVRIIGIMTIARNAIDARKEGFDTLDDLLAHWQKFEPLEGVGIWAIDFRLKKEVE